MTQNRPSAKTTIALALSAAFVCAPAFGADDEKPGHKAAPAQKSIPAPAPDQSLAQAREYLIQKQYDQAANVLRAKVATNQGLSASHHNLYAFAMRKGANPDMALIFKHYNEALRLDPNHIGAHEYIGEAYLMVGNKAKATEHLSMLIYLCGRDCEATKDLALAIAKAK